MYRIKRRNLARKLTILTALSALGIFSSCSDSGSPVDPPQIDGANKAPVLTTIGARYGSVTNQISFTVSASDAESTPTLTIANKPTTAIFIDSGNGTASFSWTPTSGQSGTFDVTFIATDDSASVDSEVVTITVITHTYDNYIAPVFSTAGCGASTCHGALPYQGGLNITTYTTVLSGGLTGKGIVPGNTGASIVYRKLLSPPPFGSRMPLNGPFFSQARLDSISVWILAGAPEN